MKKLSQPNFPTKSFRAPAFQLGALFFAFLLFAFSPSRAATTPVETSKLENGSTLLVRRDNIAPRVAISLLVRAGAAHETRATSGWRQVLAAAILRATKLEEGEKIARLSDWQSQLESWGGEIGATVDDDSIEFFVTGDSARAPELMRALLQIVSAPRLADEDFAWARRRILSLQAESEEGVAARAAQSISRQLYRDGKGESLAYALPDFGTFESLSALTNEQLRAWHAQFFVPSQMVVGVAGDVERAVLEAELKQRAWSTPGGSTPEAAPVFGALETSQPPLVVREMGVGGAWIFAAFRAPAPSALTPNENAALRVLAAALEGAGGARLPRRLLGEGDKPAGSTPGAANSKTNILAAQTAAQLTTRRWASELTVFAQTGPQNVEAVKNALLDEVRKLRDAPLSPVELQSAKNFARGQWAMGRNSLHERAFEAALTALHGAALDTKSPEELAAVSAADVQKAAQKYLRDYAVVLVMPQE